MNKYFSFFMIFSGMSAYGAKSKYLTEAEYFQYENAMFAPAIAATWKTSSLANQHGLEISLTLDLIDYDKPKNFMKCNDTNIKRNACPVNMMGGLFVVEYDSRKRDYEIYDTFWGSQDETTWPSQEELKARTNEVIDNIGYTLFVFGGAARNFISGDEFIQRLRVKTATAFYFHLNQNFTNGQIFEKVKDAAKINHMDVDRYVTKEIINKYLSELKK